MAEVGGGEGIVTQANNAAAMSFVDAEGGSDPASAILDEVLSGAPPAEPPKDGEPAEPSESPPTPDEETPKPEVEAKPEPAAEAKPAEDNTPEAIKLRKGFAKLADERQKLVERENAARNAVQSAQQYAEKARKHDELLSALQSDPAGFLLAHGGDALVKQTLQGFIDQEKSPAEREVAKLRQEHEKDRAERQRREQEQVTTAWRNDIVAKVQGDERFDLVNTFGLHNEVIDVIAGYYEKHSTRDDKGNVTAPAILPWDVAAEAVESTRAAKLEGSKKYGKRAPVAPVAKKDTPSAKPGQAPAKKAPTSLSSVPVADAPHRADELPTDPDERERALLAEFGL